MTPHLSTYTFYYETQSCSFLFKTGLHCDISISISISINISMRKRSSFQFIMLKLMLMSRLQLCKPGAA